jgi:penicillin-binding protein 1C
VRSGLIKLLANFLPERQLNRGCRKVYLSIGFLGLAFCSLVLTTQPSQLELPSEQNSPSSALWFSDRYGANLQVVRTDPTERRLQWTTLAQTSPALLEAVLAAEDQRFYQHGGVEFRSLFAAVVQNTKAIVKGERQRRGASTITMQLAGLVENKQQRRNWVNKLAQMRAAWAIEKSSTKQQILEAYLNTVYFRGEQRGIAAAAQGFFVKTPIGITQKEAVVLASMLASPQSPVAQIVQRSCRLLNKLNPTDTISPCTALDLPVMRLNKPAFGMGQDQWAPHYAQYLIKEKLFQTDLKLENRDQKDQRSKITTSIDLSIQQFAQRALAEQMRELMRRQVEDGAIVVLDNNTGEVLAYVGSSGEFSSASFFDAANAPRQAGSTLKPFLYAAAIDKKRLTAASLVDDSSLAINTADAQYIPRNYSEDFKGWVSVRRALASSLNVPAVRTLAMLDVDEFAGTLRHLGLGTVNQSGGHYGYSLALGSADVRLIDLTNAYRALANGGKWTPVQLLPKQNPSLKVNANASLDFNSSSGSNLIKDLPSTQVLQQISAQAAFVVADILADNEARALTFGLDSALRLPFRASVKTGTSKDMRDNWCIGFSDRYTVGVWVGNASGAPMRGVSGVSGAAPIWNSIMRQLHQGYKISTPVQPSMVVRQTIAFSGVNEPVRSEYFLQGTQVATVELANINQRAANLIQYPTDGAIFAIDPDIPHAKQILKFLMASSAPTKAVWSLNGKSSPNRWHLYPGKHRLALVDETGETLSQINFEVRAPSGLQLN